MSKKELLIRELEQMPDNLLDEVGNYVQYLLMKQRTTAEKASFELDLSKTAWAKNWDSKDEDEAWKDL